MEIPLTVINTRLETSLNIYQTLDVLFIGIYFLSNKNLLHNKSMSIPNGSFKKKKKKECYNKYISVQKQITKGFHDEVVYLINTYIHKYINQ